VTRTPKLKAFEGLPVTSAGVEIPSAGGGLRDALRVDPVELHKGETVFVVLQCEVGKVRFDPVDRDEPAGPQRRVHVLGTTAATIVDRELVASALDAQAERIAKASEVDGQLSIDDGAS
jgi:hypothetical protein